MDSFSGGIQAGRAQREFRRSIAALRPGHLPGRDALLFHSGGSAVLRRNPAEDSGLIHGRTAGKGTAYCRGNAPNVPARLHSKSKAYKILQRLLLKRVVSSCTDAEKECVGISEKRHGGKIMRRLLNTLFVTSEDVYLTLDGENVVANREKEVLARYPLHILSGIICFSYAGASPALMGACAERGISLSFCTPRGKFLARVSGENNGNVLLRRTQYRIADDPNQSCLIARNIIFGKLYNARWSIERTRRDHGLRLDEKMLLDASHKIQNLLPDVLQETSLDSLRGLEGIGATAYFGVFDEMILNQDDAFSFQNRSRRPPLDPVNAMLSFAYALLSNDCVSALESVGLDSYVGFLHRDRPGRSSLALDLMEELRPCMADRFVLTMLNNRKVKPADFVWRENGSVSMKDDARRIFLKSWQEKKRDAITHPYLGEKIPWGLVPYVQALLLTRTLREDLEEYPPFLWK